MSPALGILVTSAYIFAIIGLAELLRRWRGYTSNFTRKVIHIGVGMWSWALPAVFDSPWPFVWACLIFAVLLYIDWRYKLFPAMASQDQHNLGTVYFPLAAAAVVIVFWRQPPLMVAALMPLTWGDGLAPVIGRAYGRHFYTVFGHTRSLQGSGGFFVFGLLFTWLALWVMPGDPAITPLTALAPALLISLVTSLIEAVTVRGLDNLTITAAAILILSLWPF
jgi:phytol kinase